MTTDLDAMKHILETMEAQPSFNNAKPPEMVLQFMRHMIWHLEAVNVRIDDHRHLKEE